MHNDRRSVRDRMTPAARRLELLCARRSWQERDTSLTPKLAQAKDHYQNLLDTIDPMQEIWQRMVPPELASKTTLRVDKGVLRVGVRDSSIRFALDRLLRAGIESELIRQSPVTISRVKLEAVTKRRTKPGAPALTTPSTNNKSS